MPESIGKPLDRVDGRLKVTGGARYSAEMPVADTLHAVMVMSTVARGQVTAMDVTAAQAVPGVRLVMTPFTAMRLPQPPQVAGKAGREQDRHLQVLQTTDVFYSNQPIGLVIANTLEQATYGASLVKTTYASEKANVNMHKGEMYTPRRVQREEPVKVIGDPDAGKHAATKSVEVTYSTPMENHNPMEPHATTATWEAPDKLTVYDATQGVFGVRNVLSKTFMLEPDNVRCVCHFLGGGFGCKGSTWSHVVLAALAAKQVGHPVKLVLTRAQMFGMVGYRPQTEQKLSLGSDDLGKLTLVKHEVLSNTSKFDEFIEPSMIVTRMLYACPNNLTSHKLSRIDAGTPTFMRAPGESSGTWALEGAMDELAYATKIDPIQLRLQNYAEKDPGNGKPWSTKSLRQCYQVGAEAFGWASRKPEPRSMTAPDGRLIGMGMATASYPANRSGSSAMARLLPDGTAYVQAGTQDIGTGTYTIMTQIAADALTLSPAKVLFELGDTRMPETPVSGGSQTAASTGSAVQQTCMDLRARAVQMAIADPGSPVHGLGADELDVREGRIFVKANPTRGETYAELIKRSGQPSIEIRSKSQGTAEDAMYSRHSFGSVFAEVLVDPDLGEVRLSKIVGVYGVGTILNAKTARSQLIGGVVYGIGMALLEKTVMDARYARVVNHDLAEYHVPVNRDVPEIDIRFVDEFDPHVSLMGAKGVGEIGITGVVAAIGNAVYHATGVRVRDLPVTPDKVMGLA